MNTYEVKHNNKDKLKILHNVNSINNNNDNDKCIEENFKKNKIIEKS